MHLNGSRKQVQKDGDRKNMYTLQEKESIKEVLEKDHFMMNEEWVTDHVSDKKHRDEDDDSSSLTKKSK